MRVLSVCLLILWCLVGAWRNEASGAVVRTKPSPVRSILSRNTNFEHASHIRPVEILRGGNMQQFRQATVIHGVLATAIACMKQQVLTLDGLIHAAVLGTGLWAWLGPAGWSVCVAYFILGSLATKLKLVEKEKLGIAEQRGGARGPENVWGSAATALGCAFLSRVLPEYADTFQLGYVASLATKLSDTLSSEIGKAYGKNPFLITTLRPVLKGVEGAVSVEGTLAGVAGSILLALLSAYLGVMPATVQSIFICVFAAVIATTIESYIGALFQNEKNPWLTNELVNFIMTMVSCCVAMAMYGKTSVYLMVMIGYIK